MYRRRLDGRFRSLYPTIWQHPHPSRANSLAHSCIQPKIIDLTARKFHSSPFSFSRIPLGFWSKYNITELLASSRSYSSKSDGNNNAEGKQIPVKDKESNQEHDKSKMRREKVALDSNHQEEHASLCRQEQHEWIDKTKSFCDSRKRESPFLTKKERFKNEFVRRLIPWENITVSLNKFPYYLK